MQRDKKVKGFLTKLGLDAVLISSPSNISYLTNYFGFSYLERDAYLLVRHKNFYLFTNPLYANAFSKKDGLNVLVTDSERPFSSLLMDLVKNEKIQSIGYEENNLTVKEFNNIKKTKVKLFPLDEINIRETKDNQEIKNIKKACEISDKALAGIKNKIKPGISEFEVARLLEEAMRRLGGDLAFETIVAFGPNSATPHHKTGEQKLKSNDTVLIDFGAKFENYCADMTRTFFIGKPTEEQQKVYDTVLTAQKKSIELLNSYFIIHNSESRKLKAADVDSVARKYIVTQGYPSIPHSVGHGIGLEVHESPSISPFSDDTLTDGMVFSIEPGIYLPGQFGVRIEDLFLIENKNLLPLTSYASKLEVL